MNKIIYSILVIVTGVVIYRYRYSIINSVLRVRALQKLLVRFAMNIPFVRNAIFTQVFQ